MPYWTPWGARTALGARKVLSCLPPSPTLYLPSPPSLSLEFAAARLSRDFGPTFRPSPPGHCLYLCTDWSVVTLRFASAQTGFAIFLRAAGGVLGAAGSEPAAADGVSADLVECGCHPQRRAIQSSFGAKAFGRLQVLRTALDAAALAGLLFDGPVDASFLVHAFV